MLYFKCFKIVTNKSLRDGYVLLLLYYLCEIYVCTGHFNKQLLRPNYLVNEFFRQTRYIDPMLA